jgi:hypothetical protein
MQIIAKVGESVDVTYQAAKETTGLTDVTLKIFDESRAVDAINYPDVVLTEIGATGKYYGSFIPDAVGVWSYGVDSASKVGPVTGTIIVTNHNLDSLGASIAALNDLSEAEVQAIIDVSETNILNAISDLGSPPMLG